MGERRGRSINLESLPTGSVVYVGRDSFRMETVDFSDDAQGIVREMPAVTTAPYGIDVREGRVVIELDRELDRAVSSASWRAPALDSLFGSQVDVPRLAAPTGEAMVPTVAAPTRAVVELSRAALAGVVALVFLGGVATASLTLPTRTAPVAAAAQPVVIETPVEIAPEAEPVAAEPEVAAAPIPTIQVEAPVKIRATRKPHAPIRAASPQESLAVEAPAAKWVDPFAD
jgi:hypothetical protein